MLFHKRAPLHCNYGVGLLILLDKWLLYGLSGCVDRLTVKESDPLQLVCKPEGRHARLVASTQSGASKAAYGERE